VRFPPNEFVDKTACESKQWLQIGHVNSMCFNVVMLGSGTFMNTIEGNSVPSLQFTLVAFSGRDYLAPSAGQISRQSHAHPV
jgi:hypothetical protein